MHIIKIGLYNKIVSIPLTSLIEESRSQNEELKKT